MTHALLLRGDAYPMATAAPRWRGCCASTTRGGRTMTIGSGRYSARALASRGGRGSRLGAVGRGFSVGPAGPPEDRRGRGAQEPLAIEGSAGSAIVGSDDRVASGAQAGEGSVAPLERAGPAGARSFGWTSSCESCEHAEPPVRSAPSAVPEGSWSSPSRRPPGRGRRTRVRHISAARARRSPAEHALHVREPGPRKVRAMAGERRRCYWTRRLGRWPTYGGVPACDGKAGRPHRDLRALAGLVKLIRAAKPDIVHTTRQGRILGRWAAAIARVPCVIHSIHGFGFHAGQSRLVRGLYLSAERAAAKVTTRYIAVSRANRQQGIDLGLFAPSRCVVIRSGVDLARFRQASGGTGAFRRELGLGPRDPLVGMIACLKPQKAPTCSVAVAARVLQAEPPHVRDRRRRAAALRRREADLAGFARPERIRSSDGGGTRRGSWPTSTFLLLTSRWAGTPGCFRKPCAGKPVVATRVDGSPRRRRASAAFWRARDTWRCRETLRFCVTGLRSRMGEAAEAIGEWTRRMVRSRRPSTRMCCGGGRTTGREQA